MIKVVIKDILLKWMLNILKIHLTCIEIYHSYQKESKLKTVCNIYGKETYVAHKRNRKEALNHGLIL